MSPYRYHLFSQIKTTPNFIKYISLSTSHRTVSRNITYLEATSKLVSDKHLSNWKKKWNSSIFAIYHLYSFFLTTTLQFTLFLLFFSTYPLSSTCAIILILVSYLLFPLTIASGLSWIFPPIFYSRSFLILTQNIFVGFLAIALFLLSLLHFLSHFLSNIISRILFLSNTLFPSLSL